MYRKIKIVFLVLAIILSPVALLQEAHAMSTGVIPYSQSLWTAEVASVIIALFMLALALLVEILAPKEEKK